MSPKEKLEEMARKGIERRASEVTCCSKSRAATEGVVIYGVPLNEKEIKLLYWCLAFIDTRVSIDLPDAEASLATLQEMLERGEEMSLILTPKGPAPLVEWLREEIRSSQAELPGLNRQHYVRHWTRGRIAGLQDCLDKLAFLDSQPKEQSR